MAWSQTIAWDMGLEHKLLLGMRISAIVLLGFFFLFLVSVLSAPILRFESHEAVMFYSFSSPLQSLPETPEWQATKKHPAV